MLRIVGVHVFSVYALVLVGTVADRIGGPVALACGLPVLAASTLGPLWIESVAAAARLVSGLGVGWNLSIVAVTAELIDATSPSERGRVLGFDDRDLPPRQCHTITTRPWHAFETALQARIADAAITATAHA